MPALRIKGTYHPVFKGTANSELDIIVKVFLFFASDTTDKHDILVSYEYCC